MNATQILIGWLREQPPEVLEHIRSFNPPRLYFTQMLHTDDDPCDRIAAEALDALDWQKVERELGISATTT